MKKKQTLTLLIVIMLAAIAVSALWLHQRSIAIREAREKQEALLEQQRAEEEAAAKKEAEDAEVASHVYSHRGSAGPEEHSFSAYDAAIEAGSRYIEPDVVLSADGVLYVSHDENAASMTGVNAAYAYMDSEAIDELRTGAGNRILRLSEVFDQYGASVNYVIEIKPDSEDCAAALEDMVDEYGLGDVVTVQSRFTGILEKLEENHPDMPKLFVCRNQGDFEYALEQPYVDIISVNAAAGLMTEGNCASAHEHGKKFSAWTLDTEDQIKQAIDIGVDTYFTNDTPLALSLERDYGLKTRAENAAAEQDG